MQKYHIYDVNDLESFAGWGGCKIETPIECGSTNKGNGQGRVCYDRCCQTDHLQTVGRSP